VERLVSAMRQEFLDHVLFWNACDLERKLADFQTYANAARKPRVVGALHAVDIRRRTTVTPSELNNVRWASHCLDLVQLPEAT
jgi:hypothetical protein